MRDTTKNIKIGITMKEDKKKIICWYLKFAVYTFKKITSANDCRRALFCEKCIDLFRGVCTKKKHTSSMRERKIDENKCLTEVTFVVNNSRSGKVFALSHLLIFSRMKMYVCVCAKKISARVYATHNIIIIIIQRKYKLIHTCSLQRYTLIYFFFLFM